MAGHGTEWRFLLPEGGVPLLDAPGEAFHDPEAGAAFTSITPRLDRSASGATL